MPRLILLLHRYLGVTVGALMAMWCLSGVVMMYHSYPVLDEDVRVAHLEPIAWNACCKIPDLLPGGVQPGSIRIEMLGSRPVLQLGEDSRPIDLLTGAFIERISADQAAEVAKRFATTNSPQPQLLGLIDRDQWTVSGDFNSERPLFRFGLGDAADTELYVSSSSGRAVQLTTARERFWNWLGAVPHWLYFTELRRHSAVWSQVVIYASLLGCFLAGLGIYLGVRQLTVQPAGRWSPYVGFNLWHHIAGLAFGILTLTWVLSGLLSMNPWGWLQGAGAHSESARIQGAPRSSPEGLAAALHALADAHPAIVSLKAAPLNGRLYFIASTAGGERLRLDEGGAQAPLGSEDLKFLAQVLAGDGPTNVPEFMTREDNFYFSHHELAALPVYRLILASGTRYYLDSVSGMFIAKYDAEAQAYRWLHGGLHRMDFAVSVRGHPQWDALMLLLMSGVTLVCVTGAVLGYRRLTRRQGVKS